MKPYKRPRTFKRFLIYWRDNLADTTNSTIPKGIKLTTMAAKGAKTAKTAIAATVKRERIP